MSSGGKGGGGGGSQVRGYKYFFSILMGLCRGPIDQLVAIEVSEVPTWPAKDITPPDPPDPKTVQQVYNPGDPFPDGQFADLSYAPVVDNQRFGINLPQLFGGDAGEGGIVGNALMLMGSKTQVVPGDVKSGISDGDVAGHDYIYDNAGVGHDTDAGGGTRMPVELISDFRGVATLWFKGQVCSNNPYPKAWRMRLRRCYQGWDKNGCWYPDKVMIPLQNGLVRAMNPAHILYQIITDATWGRGMDRSEMDDAGFTYAANWLYDEGFGLNLKWDRNQDINTLIQTVIDHIGGVLYVDRGTGLMTLRLLRQDYTVANLPVFNYSSGVLKVENVETGAATVLANEIVVKYTDPIKNKERSCRVHNLASIQSIGETISQTKTYYGIGDEALARRIALRDLKALSCDLRRMKVSMDRRGWKLQPGSVFLLEAADKGIAQMVVRVVSYDDGTMTNGTIVLECVQDVFGMPSTVFTSEPNPEWRGGVAPSPVPSQNQIAYEASYYDMVRGLTPADAAAVKPDEGGIVIAAQKPVPNAVGSLVTATPTGGTANSGYTDNFVPVGVLRYDLGYYDTTVALSRGTDLGHITVGSSARIGTETVKVMAVDLTAGTVTVARGATDTIPAQHTAGAPIFFIDPSTATHTGLYAAGETVAVQIMPRTQTGTLSADQVATSTVTVTGAHAAPYPPGNVQINGKLALVPGGYFLDTSAVTMTWASRNKVLQADQLVGTLDGSVVAEPGTTYTIQVYNAGDSALLLDMPGITDLSASFDVAGLLARGFGYNYGSDYGGTAVASNLDLVLFAVLNGVPSTKYHIPVVPVFSGAVGFGGSFGYAYGG